MKELSDFERTLSEEAFRWQQLALMQQRIMNAVAAQQSEPSYNFHWRDLALIGTVCFLFIFAFFAAVFVASSPNLAGPNDDGTLAGCGKARCEHDLLSA